MMLLTLLCAALLCVAGLPVVSAKGSVDDFAIINGFKCAEKNYKKRLTTETLGDCVEACAKTKWCQFAHYFVKKKGCSMWKRRRNEERPGVCKNVVRPTTNEKDFYIIALASKKTGLFEARFLGYWNRCDGNHEGTEVLMSKYKELFPAKRKFGRGRSKFQKRCIRDCAAMDDCTAVFTDKGFADESEKCYTFKGEGKDKVCLKHLEPVWCDFYKSCGNVANAGDGFPHLYLKPGGHRHFE